MTGNANLKNPLFLTHVHLFHIWHFLPMNTLVPNFKGLV